MLGEFHYVFVWRFLLFQYHNYDSHSDDQVDLRNPISKYILSTIWHCWCSMMKPNHTQLLYYTHKFSNLIMDLNNLTTFAVTTWQIYHLYSPNNWIRPIHMKFWCCNSVAWTTACSCIATFYAFQSLRVFLITCHNSHVAPRNSQSGKGELTSNSPNFTTICNQLKILKIGLWAASSWNFNLLQIFPITHTVDFSILHLQFFHSFNLNFFA